ncbi:TetR/AcrR family transcriptional regulator [Nubsella zeaxanthinifaciens]|uniref:TetR/AcrR family transcriptional regulator n=1 Tax=Nubsella zeaxanthinifaciens TaxID=392412 RepID=UPI003D0693FD
MEKTNIDSTEQKIKEAARRVFIKKGFAATRTRDIAEAADINLALVNYYFRSKSKLFEIIMMETLGGFLKEMLVVLNERETSLQEKIAQVASRYIDLIIKEPEIPTFIITEAKLNPQLLASKLPIKQLLENSVFFGQHREMVDKGLLLEPNPIHFLLNLIGMVVFPFLAKPLLMEGASLDEVEFKRIMLERKDLIPLWMKAMMR